MEKCTNAAFCKNCNQAHSPKDKKCPAYLKEDAIIHLKTDKNWSYSEAKEIYEQERNKATFASKVQGRLQQARGESEKDEEIKKLKLEIEKLKEIAKEIVMIKAQNIKLRESYKSKLEENLNLIRQNMTTAEATQPSTDTHTSDGSTSEDSNKTIIKRTLSKTNSYSQPPGKKIATHDDKAEAIASLEDSSQNDFVPKDDEVLDDEKMT